LEPTVVALAQLVGEKVNAPLEVVEVAQHVLNRIAHLALRDDPWRVDPSTLPITPPE